MPDSMLAAAKKLASAASLPWAHVQKYYRALQEHVEVGVAKEGWLPPDELPNHFTGLPKSKGRAVWAAHPNFMARLLVALAAADTPAGARRAVETFIVATENGEGRQNVEEALSSALTKEDVGRDIESIEFYSDTARVSVNSKSRGPIWYWIEEEELQRDGATVPVNRQPALIRSRGVIDGELINILRSEIAWRHDDWPLITDDGPDEDSAE